MEVASRCGHWTIVVHFGKVSGVLECVERYEQHFEYVLTLEDEIYSLEPCRHIVWTAKLERTA